MLGIKQDSSKLKEANEYLKNKTKGQKVFIKFDNKKYDNENNLQCYLYLKNKTFLNAHLIKQGLVLVDKEADFKHKDKFMNLTQKDYIKNEN